MKKFFIGIILGAPLLAMTACSSDSNSNDDDAIDVRALTNRHRATEITTTDLTGFSVYAYNTVDPLITSGDAPTFMYDVHVTRPDASNTWSYSPIRYWPSDRSYLSFYAYGPLNNEVGFIPEDRSISGLPGFIYTSPADVREQIDLIWAKREALTRDVDGSFPVLMDFYHALSQIVFNAQGGVENVTFNITRLEVFGLAYFGEFSYADEKWSSLGTEKTYYAIDLSDEYGTGKEVVSGQWTELTSSAENTALMTFPQTITPGGSVDDTDATAIDPQDGNAYIRITFGAKDETGAQIVPDNYTYIAPFVLDTTNNILEQGIRYRVQLTITGITNGGEAEDGEAPTDPGNGKLNAIEFEVSVNDFLDWDNIHITL